MKKVLTTSASFLLAMMLSAAAWAAESPIGALVVEGKASITAAETTFTLEDQEYAYFSRDVVETADASRAVITTSDGLRVALSPSSVVQLTQEEGGYAIDLQQGTMAVDARQGLAYRITRDGKDVTGAEQFMAGGEAYLASVSGDEDVRFYQPAQLDGDDDDIDELLMLLGGGAAGQVILKESDDEDPSS